MKHAGILAHPDRESLTAAIARTYAEAVRGLGDEAVERGIYPCCGPLTGLDVNHAPRSQPATAT